jgi:SDR family mycofactocin-dependent oxidoreductase
MSPGTGRVAGKVAFVTGIARGQGRGHAVRLAEEGADIIGLDICGPVETIPVEQGTLEDLAETVRQVESLDRRIIAGVADIRDQQAVDAVVVQGLAEFGHIDIVAANAGTCAYGKLWEFTDQEWRTMVDVILTGTFHTAKAAIPHMIEAGRGGSLIFCSSVGGLDPMPGLGHYVAAKHGVVGLMRNLAAELGPYGIRSNAILPGNTKTPLGDAMIDQVFAPMLRATGDPDWATKLEPTMASLNPMNLPYVYPEDQANALLWFASDESRYVTGQTLAIDAGWSTWLK